LRCPKDRKAFLEIPFCGHRSTLFERSIAVLVSKPVAKAWPHALVGTLLLMVPFDFITSLGMDVYLPVVPRMPVVLHTTPDIIQITLSAYLLIIGSGQLGFGPLSDRLGRRPVLLGSAILFCAASVGLATATSPTVFVAFRIAQAFGAAGCLVATFATVRDVYAHRPEGATIYGLFGGLLSLVPAFGPVLGAWIEQLFGWRSIFWFLAVFCGAAGVHAFLRWPETRPAAHRTVRWTDVAHILKTGTFWSFTLGSGTAMGAFFVFFSTASRVLIGRMGMAPTGFSLVFGTVAAVMILASKFSARRVLRRGEARCLRDGMILFIVGAVLLLIGQVFFFPSIAAFILPMWLVAVGITVTLSGAINGALRPFDGFAGTATAVHACVESLIVTGAGTLAVISLPEETAWPLIGFCIAAPLATLLFARRAAAPSRGTP
jgi:DHA1 family florfenicol/chloramphenicol resistance protein-like MFS transporter